MGALRLGRPVAADALASAGDAPAAPDAAEFDRHLGLDEEGWSALRLG